MNIIIVGLNHKTAPVEIRESLAFSSEDSVSALNSLISKSFLLETIIISTCNRVEILAICTNSDIGINQIKDFFCEFKNVKLEQFESALYVYKDKNAVRHLFRVASSLDSMIIGEPQILGQIKNSYQISIKKKTSGVILNKLLHRTFFIAKRVRSETGIGDHAVSISYAAVELAKKIFKTLENKDILLIGAGEMAELAVEHLIRHKVKKIYVGNRTFERACELAKKYNGSAIIFENIEHYLKNVDIIISSTGSSSFVINKDKMKKIMKARKHQPVFFIDIAVPRDIDPEINKISNAYVYDIDDLKGVIDENINHRKDEAQKAEVIIDEAVINFFKWIQDLELVPTIKGLKSKIELICELELKKTINHLKTQDEHDQQAIERMLKSITNKVLHDPINFLKGKGYHKDRSIYLDITRKLFNLDNH